MPVMIRMRQIRIMRKQRGMLRRQRQLRIKQHTRIDTRSVGSGEKTKRGSERWPASSRVDPGLVEVGKQVRGRVNWGSDAYIRRGILAGWVGRTWGIFRGGCPGSESGAAG